MVWIKISHPHAPSLTSTLFQATLLSFQRIKLVFTDFTTEFGYDFVRLYDGPSSSHTLLGEWSGSYNSSFDNYTSQNVAFVVFETDFSIVASGFQANWCK